MPTTWPCVSVSAEGKAACPVLLGSSSPRSLGPQSHRHWLESLSSIFMLLVDLRYFLKGSKFLPFLILLAAVDRLLCVFSRH